MLIPLQILGAAAMRHRYKSNLKKNDPSLVQDNLQSIRDEHLEGMTDSRQRDLVNSYTYAPYQRSFFESLWTGITGKKSKAELNYDMANEQDLRNKLAELDSTASEEDYNDYDSQDARMRAAGLNPDLLGVDGNTDASEMSEPDTMQSGAGSLSPVDSVLSGMSEIGRFVAGILDTGLAVAQGIPEIQHVLGQNKFLALSQTGQDLENYARAFGMSKDIADSFISANPNSEFGGNLYDNIMQVFQDAGVSRKARHYLGAGLTSYLKSGEYEGKRFKVGDNFLESRFQYNLKAHNKLYEDFYDGMNNLQKSLIAGVEKAMQYEQIYRAARYDADAARADYEKAVTLQQDPDKEAAARNAGFDADAAIANFQKANARVQKAKLKFDKMFIAWQSDMLEGVFKSVTPTSALNPASWSTLMLASKILGYNAQGNNPERLGLPLNFVNTLANVVKAVK